MNILTILIAGLAVGGVQGDVRTPVRLLSGSLNNSDYPAAARGASGTAIASLTVGMDGRVSNCVISQSSGNAALDAATCPIITGRFRFRPATLNGQVVVGTYGLTMRWVAPR